VTVLPAPSFPAVTPGTGHAFGTFGELLQGVLPDGDVDFLVTLPLDRWSRARFRLQSGRPLRVFPATKRKSLLLARALLDSVASRAGGILMLDSDLPEGKGLASSSADLVATARAVGSVLGLDMSPAAIERLLRRIEPSDGVMYLGVVAFEHRRVRLRQFLGSLPAMTVVALDEGGQVDTVAFNRIPKGFSSRDKHEYATLLDRLADAVHRRDLVAVGEVASRSAVLNQRLHPKRCLPQMLALAREAGALGVVAAHSGTMVGILLDDGAPGHYGRLARLTRACRQLPGSVSVFRSLGFEDVSREALSHAV
jgi:uncharacterized protein involved in propanediol utilization